MYHMGRTGPRTRSGCIWYRISLSSPFLSMVRIHNLECGKIHLAYFYEMIISNHNINTQCIFFFRKIERPHHCTGHSQGYDFWHWNSFLGDGWRPRGVTKLWAFGWGRGSKFFIKIEGHKNYVLGSSKVSLPPVWSIMITPLYNNKKEHPW